MLQNLLSSRMMKNVLTMVKLHKDFPIIYEKLKQVPETFKIKSIAIIFLSYSDSQ